MYNTYIASTSSRPRELCANKEIDSIATCSAIDCQGPGVIFSSGTSCQVAIPGRGR